MARYLPFSKQIQIAMQATAAATQKMIVDTAKREHDKVMSTDPRPGIFTREVDGRLGAPLESVRPHGVVHFRYPRFDGVVEFALETLRRFSPVDRSKYKNEIVYRDSHFVFLNGREVDVETLAKLWKPGDEIAIGNSVPYARKIEVGAMTFKTGNEGKVYARAERIIKARYSKLVSIRFTYRGIASGTGRGGNRVDRDTRQPVLLIREL